MQLTDDVILRRPEGDVDGVQGGEQGEPPGDALNDGAVAVLSELVYDGTEEQKVYDSPEDASVTAQVRTPIMATHQIPNAHGAGET